MGIPTRHANAPYIDGENVAGVDLETDIGGLFAEIANIQNVNIPTGAGIVGSKLADLSIPTSKLIDRAVTQAKIAANACSVSAVTDIDAAIALTAAYADLVTVALTTGTPVGSVLVLCGADVDFTTMSSPGLEFQLVREFLFQSKRSIAQNLMRRRCCRRRMPRWA